MDEEYTEKPEEFPLDGDQSNFYEMFPGFRSSIPYTMKQDLKKGRLKFELEIYNDSKTTDKFSKKFNETLLEAFDYKGDPKMN